MLVEARVRGGVWVGVRVEARVRGVVWPVGEEGVGAALLLLLGALLGGQEAL